MDVNSSMPDNPATAPSVIQAVRKTTFIDAPRLSAALGIDVTLASETFQHTGSFKFRAAYSLASRVQETTILTASSGNFGQALAYACKLLGKSAIVVMPESSAKVKIDAVRGYGARVELIDTAQTSRADRVAELAEAHPDAYVASAYNDPLVIAGNASLGHELAPMGFDEVIVPIGGGGLSSGIVQGFREAECTTRVCAAEPLLGNDAARSLREGRLVKNEQEPQTLADGARTVSLGENNWHILRDGLSRIVEVPETAIVEGVKMLFSLANLKAEPTSALSVGAILTSPDVFEGQKVCCIVTGANVDPALYARLIT